MTQKRRRSKRRESDRKPITMKRGGAKRQPGPASSSLTVPSIRLICFFWVGGLRLFLPSLAGPPPFRTLRQEGGSHPVAFPSGALLRTTPPIIPGQSPIGCCPKPPSGSGSLHRSPRVEMQPGPSQDAPQVRLRARPLARKPHPRRVGEERVGGERLPRWSCFPKWPLWKMPVGRFGAKRPATGAPSLQT